MEDGTDGRDAACEGAMGLERDVADLVPSSCSSKGFGLLLLLDMILRVRLHLPVNLPRNLLVPGKMIHRP